MPVDVEKILVNQPTVADLTEIICRQLEDIKRLENVLKHYDWIVSAKYPPTKEDGMVLAQFWRGEVYPMAWASVAASPHEWPYWCRIRPINRRTT
jgi:hypothetical protein